MTNWGKTVKFYYSNTSRQSNKIVMRYQSCALKFKLSSTIYSHRNILVLAERKPCIGQRGILMQTSTQWTSLMIKFISGHVSHKLPLHSSFMFYFLVAILLTSEKRMNNAIHCERVSWACILTKWILRMGFYCLFWC